MRRTHHAPIVPLLLAGLAVGGCDCRGPRPLNPCTTAGLSSTVALAPIHDVDLLFVVDDSGSMMQEQAKLRAQFPAMVRALLTGDPTPADPNDRTFPRVDSLRIAVVTSDMGVAGVGTTPETASTRILSCGASPSGLDAQRARYGDDGVFRTMGHSFLSSGVVQLGCDADGNGVDDSVTAAMLPGYLTFDNPTSGAPTPAAIDEFVRRASCFTNVGTTGCAFEQPLESMLKALTPASESASLVGGPFYATPGDADGALGHLDDPATNAGWLRDDSLLAIVYVSDEDDCSATDPRVFDYNSTDPAYHDAFGAYQAQTRCARYEDGLVLPTDRYVEGILARRKGRERMIVFAAITGVPSDLTDGVGAPSGVVEGTTNLPQILADPRMAYTYQTERIDTGSGSVDVPAASLAPGCVHTVPGERTTASGDLVAGSAMIAALTVTNAPSFAPIPATANLAAGSSTLTSVTLPLGARAIEPGMIVAGVGIAPGTVATYVVGDAAGTGPFTIGLSAAATQTTASATLTFGTSFGPAPGQLVTGVGLAFDTTVRSVTGSGPYVITLSDPAMASGAAVALELGTIDVQATPGRRVTRVAEGLRAAEASVTVQSICVDDFAPAMRQVLSQIQSNLDGSCLRRPLNRNATGAVDCDVFVTLPPNTACADVIGMQARDSLVPTMDARDLDGQLERCVAQQVRGFSGGLADGGSAASQQGWFYDDYTDAIASCRDPQRISFTAGSLPPDGSSMKIGCIQPVQTADLRMDLYRGCNDDTACAFPSAGDEADFVLRYNLAPHGWTNGASALICEDVSKTCQIPCGSDADCPGGFDCWDDGGTIVRPYCVNPTCGAGF